MAEATDHPATGVPSTSPLVLDLPSAARPLRRGAILIVEDRDDVREGLSQLLEFQGYVVFEAANANEAFGHLDANPTGIALIVLDLVLPGIGGPEIRAAQLANPVLSTIPIVVASACARDGYTGADLHAAGWLEKPFRFEQLLAEVRRFVMPESERTSWLESPAECNGRPYDPGVGH